MEGNPLITVIMPAFNAGEFIEASLECLFRQTYKNLEIIVVNDGSTDNTNDILLRYSGRIKVIQTEKLGVSNARNVGILQAEGEYIAFLDSDDIWMEDKLECQLSMLGTENWSFTDCYYIGDGQDGTTLRSTLSQPYSGMIFEKLIVENFLTTSSILIKKKTLLETGLFDTDMRLAQDWKLWLEISKSNAISYVSRPLVQYRIYKQSATRRKASDVLPFHLKIIEDAFDDVNMNKDHLKLKKYAQLRSINICSYIAEDRGDFRFALYCTSKCLIRDPFSLLHAKRFLRSLLNILKNAIC